MRRRPAALALGARPVRNCRRLWPPARSLTHQPAPLFIVTNAQGIFKLLTSPPVLEKEVFKALLARDAGNDVRQLVLIGDPGAALLSHAPTPASIIDWVERWHQIRVQIWDLNDMRES